MAVNASIAARASVFRRALRWFEPAPAKPLLPEADVRRRYPKLRWQVFEAAFIAYATFYLVRNNLAPVSKEMGAVLHYDKAMIGDILAGTAIAYGIGKLVMGYFSDRSDARKYVAAGMVATALLNIAFGATASYPVHVALWTLNGLVQGMGYGPCTRGLSHWFAASERGSVFGVWNISHNIGGGIAGFLAAWCAGHWGWTSAFYVPAAIALLGAVYLFWRMRDTPQSEGLPAIQEYKKSAETSAEQADERELSAREIFLQYILPNRTLWVLAIANIFVYIARYAMVDWGPTYLKEVKGASLAQGGLSTLVIEFAGAAGMLCMGWLSDKLGGRRARVAAVAILPLMLAFAALRLTPAGMLWLDLTLFAVIGFFVYTPVMFSGVISLDLTHKKAVGTAAGFVGLFGYIGRVVQGKGLGWTAQHMGWDAGLIAVLGCTMLAFVLLLLMWNVKPRA